MYCKNCGVQINDNQVVCVSCGCAVGTGFNFCANCGAQLPPNAVACMSCGVAANFGVPNQNRAGGFMPAEDAWVPAGKEKIVAILLAFFLGGFGVHNFYLGETKKGILRLLTCWFGLGGILAFIDFIKMLIGSYTVDPNKLI